MQDRESRGGVDTGVGSATTTNVVISPAWLKRSRQGPICVASQHLAQAEGVDNPPTPPAGQESAGDRTSELARLTGGGVGNPVDLERHSLTRVNERPHVGD